MAGQWLNLYTQGLDSRSIMVQAIQSMNEQERELEDKLCQQLVA
jgi:hypothetical protein